MRLRGWVMIKEAVIAVGTGECVDGACKIGSMTCLGAMPAVEGAVGWRWLSWPLPTGGGCGEGEVGHVCGWAGGCPPGIQEVCTGSGGGWVTGRGLDAAGEFLQLFIDGGSLLHETADLLCGVHDRGVVTSAEGLADLG